MHPPASQPRMGCLAGGQTWAALAQLGVVNVYIPLIHSHSSSASCAVATYSPRDPLELSTLLLHFVSLVHTTEESIQCQPAFTSEKVLAHTHTHTRSNYRPRSRDYSISMLQQFAHRSSVWFKLLAFSIAVDDVDLHWNVTGKAQHGGTAPHGHVSLLLQVLG